MCAKIVATAMPVVRVKATAMLRITLSWLIHRYRYSAPIPREVGFRCVHRSGSSGRSALQSWDDNRPNCRAIAGLRGIPIGYAALSRKYHRHQFDVDHDSTVDIDEAKKAASDLFDKLDTDKEGTVSIKELHGRLSSKDFAGADPDKDKTLTKDEYLAVVEKRFKAADTDNDSTVSADEFRTPAGRALEQLLH